MQKRYKKLTDYAKRQEEDAARQPKLDEKSVTPDRKIAEGSESVLREVLEAIIQRYRSTHAETSKQARQEPEETGETERRSTANEILELAQEAYQRTEVKLIECDKQGTCNDGRRVGEVYEDSKGLKWQRGFLSTSRIPIFVDFIVEEAKIAGRVGKAFIIVSSRDSKAIIPEDYICEASSKYGILLDLEKCSSFRISPWSSKSKKKQK